jgi:hypothetical protein
MRRPHFHIALAPTPPLALGDGLILLALAGLLYVGARLALAAPATVTGAEISLAPQALPWWRRRRSPGWARRTRCRSPSAWPTATGLRTTGAPSAC